MDLNIRVDHIDEEMKLLKNEIKQVLLEVQEHVLNAQNPFNMGGGGFSGVSSPAPAVAAAPTAGGFSGGGGFGGGGGAVEVMQPVGARVSSGTGLLSPALGLAEQSFGQADTNDPLVTDMSQPGAPEESAPSTPKPSGALSELDSGGPSLGPDMPSSFSDDLNSDGPSLGPDASEPGLASGFDAFDDFDEDDFKEPAIDSSASSPARSGAKTQRKTSSSRKTTRSGDRARSREEKKEVVTQPERNSERSSGSRKVENDYWDSDDDESVANEGDTNRAGIDPNIDLITIAGLAQWCNRALDKIGRENLETLVQVSELTGRVSKEMKDILMTLLPLFDGKKEDIVSAKEIVSLLAQLDSLLVSGTASADNRLLPFILQDDIDFFTIMRQ